MTLFFLAACRSDSFDGATSAPSRCEDPVAGMARFTEEGASRGLTLPEPGADRHPGVGKLLVDDLDADGDLDMLYTRGAGMPLVARNDGAGHFEVEEAVIALDSGGRSLEHAALADVDGDELPDLLIIFGESLLVAPNLGGSFGEPAWVRRKLESSPSWSAVTLGIGDADGDGDLDFVLPVIATDPGQAEGGPTWLYLQTPTGFEGRSLGVEPLNVQAALWTDRDLDGDLDLLLANDLGNHRTTFWRNDGGGPDGVVLVEDSAEVGFELSMAAMGMDEADLNGDLLPDYCFSNVGPMMCFLSDERGWYEAAASLGLHPAEADSDSTSTIGWSIELADLDNDGLLDAVQASGEFYYRTGEIYRDRLWQGLPDGTFTDVTEELGFGDPRNHVGMATADFDGDGAVEIVMVDSDRPPVYWQNHCTVGRWLEVDPVGPRGNRAGYGARVEVEAGGQVRSRMVHALRSHGQGPSLLHFGLGTVDRVDRVRVVFPDGSVSEATDVSVDQRLRVLHPDAE